MFLPAAGLIGHVDPGEQGLVGRERTLDLPQTLDLELAETRRDLCEFQVQVLPLGLQRVEFLAFTVVQLRLGEQVEDPAVDGHQALDELPSLQFQLGGQCQVVAASEVIGSGTGQIKVEGRIGFARLV